MFMKVVSQKTIKQYFSDFFCFSIPFILYIFWMNATLISNFEVHLLHRINPYCTVFGLHLLYRMHSYSRTTGAWTYHSFAFFQNLKPVEVWKCHVNIIWRSLKNKCLCKISELWLKNWACHALFNFELLKGVAASFFEPHPPNFGQACFFYRCSNVISIIFL